MRTVIAQLCQPDAETRFSPRASFNPPTRIYDTPVAGTVFMRLNVVKLDDRVVFHRQ